MVFSTSSHNHSLKSENVLDDCKCNTANNNMSIIVTLNDEDDAVVDKLVTDDSESIEPPFLRLDSEP